MSLPGITGIAGIIAAVAGGGGGGVPVNGTKIRVTTQAVPSAGNWATIGEIEVAAYVGGPDLCVGGTPSATANNGTAHFAVDNNPGNVWTTGTGTMPQSWEYDFGAVVSVGEVRIYCANTFDTPKDFDIEVWNGSAWVMVKQPRGVTWAAVGEWRSFPIGGKSYQVWRLQGVTMQDPGEWFVMPECEMRATSGGADQTAVAGSFYLASATAGGNSADKAFDNNTGTAWIANTNNPVIQWIEHHFPTSTSVGEILIRSGGVPGGSWAAFKLQVHDSDNLIDVASYSGQVWIANENKVFAVPAVAATTELRGSNYVRSASANNLTVPIPAGAVAGDDAILVAGTSWAVNNPAGWTLVGTSTPGGTYNGKTFKKTLTTADITAGSFNVTFTNSHNCHLQLFVFKGPKTIRASVHPFRNGPQTVATSFAATIGDFILQAAQSRDAAVVPSFAKGTIIHAAPNHPWLAATETVAVGGDITGGNFQTGNVTTGGDSYYVGMSLY